jgi:hypothetical protein
MLFPTILARIEQTRNASSLPINPAQVRSLAKVASRAAVCQVLKSRWSAMLFRNHVIGVKVLVNVCLGHLAILAAAIGPLHDLFSKSGLHVIQAADVFGRNADRALACNNVTESETER